MGRDSRRKQGPTPAPPVSEKEKAQQAVETLWQVTSQVSMPLSAHSTCQQARDILLAFIERSPEPGAP